MTDKQIIKNIANLIKDNTKKIEQLRKVQDITFNLTSDDYIDIKMECYENNIVRYLIEGTRANMTITANVLKKEIIRKPRNEKPWYSANGRAWAYEILDEVRAQGGKV